VHSFIFNFAVLFEEFVIKDESLLMGIHNDAVTRITPPTSWRQKACEIDNVMMIFDICWCRCLNAHPSTSWY
jgi:hypothetical protein